MVQVTHESLSEADLKILIAGAAWNRQTELSLKGVDIAFNLILNASGFFREKGGGFKEEDLVETLGLVSPSEMKFERQDVIALAPHRFSKRWGTPDIRHVLLGNCDKGLFGRGTRLSFYPVCTISNIGGKVGHPDLRILQRTDGLIFLKPGEPVLFLL